MQDEAIDTATDGRPSLRERLTTRGAHQWYIGGGSGLLWQSILVITVVTGPLPTVSKVVGLAFMAVLYAMFMLLGPIIWIEPARSKVLIIVGYWALTCLLFPLIGADTIWVWLLVVSTAAFTGLRIRYALVISVLVVAVQLLIAASHGFGFGLLFAPIATGVGAVAFIALGFISTSNQSLKVAHEEIARLAVVEERARFGRDLHDVLGHSLTVVTVKSDLARRLVKIDPDRAEAEIADIEKLARSALSDLRLAVSNYREISLDSELVAASTALSAAGIEANLPVMVDPVDPRLQGVFAWVLREGVTNVIRHSGAVACWVTIDREQLTIADNGHGPDDAAIVVRVDHGNGLRGLRERTGEVGAELLIGRSIHGGFELTARRAA
ncbi:sensor histidine kinase [Glaciihabitans sp. UYNi722]|uniref:sensor histidine kinase n=1 Tax=Glaciihabitans sp. UYNi722 TaxID=3156344 RepID=UPI003394A59F